MEQMNTINNFGSGFYKIWKVHKKTGHKELIVDQKNTILFQGSDLLAFALAGVKYAKISNVYAGYVNIPHADIGTFTPPTINKNYDVPFTAYGDVDTIYEDYGYLRLPLAYTPSYQASTTDYDNNIVIFTSIISSDQTGSGADFLDSTSVPDQSHIFEIALIAALDPTSTNRDKIFSRANFIPIMYDQNYNLTISWGIQFVA